MAIYARASAAENRPHVESQAERLVAYCAAKGYHVRQVMKEIGSGVNDSRPTFLKLLADPAVEVLVVEHKDRATRFGVRSIETLLEQQGRHIEVVNLAENGREDLWPVWSPSFLLSARACIGSYRQRRATRKTETIVKEPTGQDAADAADAAAITLG